MIKSDVNEKIIPSRSTILSVNDTTIITDYLRKASTIYNEFKHYFDQGCKLHGSYANGTYNEFSDVDIMTTSLQNIRDKLPYQNKF